MGNLYAEDKPKDCQYCYWWNLQKKSCILTEERCYYLIKASAPKNTPCTDCPYGRVQPSIGYCLKKIMGQGGVGYYHELKLIKLMQECPMNSTYGRGI